MSTTATDHDLDIIFGEFRDHTVVQEFVRAIRAANLKGTLYMGYPVLSVDDGRIEYDAVLVSRDHGVVVFDIYSYQGNPAKHKATSTIEEAIVAKQEQLYAALYNKLNSFKELRKGRTLLVRIYTVTIHPIANTFVEENDARLVSRERLGELPKLPPSEQLDEVTIQHLNAAIQRISNLKPQKKRENVTRNDSQGAIIKAIEAQIANLDLWQKRGSIEYVNGPQRIRGLAGSGKTVVLALKAAYLHVKRPDWNIAITFNTRSLYQQFETLIRRFVYSQINDEPDMSKLHIMHAWGSWQKTGIYSQATSLIGTPYRDFNTAARLYGYNTAFDGVCTEALEGLGSRNLDLYDMVLIDEAQDLPPSFFRLVYKLAKAPKRIVWAYDDLQNLGEYQMPSEVELFGKDAQGRPLVRLQNKTDEPQEDIVLPRCYRNPPWTLVSAHGLGFGIYRDSLVQMFPEPDIWRRLGYREAFGELDFDQDVVVERDPQSIPEFFGKLLDENTSLQVHAFATKAEQNEWMAKTIKRLIEQEELQHSDILVILPDVLTSRSASGHVLKALNAVGLQGHVPGLGSSKDEVFQKGSIAVTHVFRAKGNEAPVVFVLDADYCDAWGDLKKRRNVLFTAITRSRAWTYICGVGDSMVQVKKEFDAIRQANFRLAFHYPKKDDIEKLSVSKDMGRISGSNPAEIEQFRGLVKKIKEQGGFEQLPPDVQRELQDLIG